MTESLAQKRMQMLTKARNEFLFKNVWTQDGKKLVKSDDYISNVKMIDASFCNFFNRIWRRKLCLGITFT